MKKGVYWFGRLDALEREEYKKARDITSGYSLNKVLEMEFPNLTTFLALTLVWKKSQTRDTEEESFKYWQSIANR